MLWTRKQVEKATQMSRALIYKEMRKGRFPLPVKVSESGKAVRWKVDEIAEFVNSRERSHGKRRPPKAVA